MGPKRALPRVGLAIQQHGPPRLNPGRIAGGQRLPNRPPIIPNHALAQREAGSGRAQREAGGEGQSAGEEGQGGGGEG
jgi:hypothetical protein